MELFNSLKHLFADQARDLLKPHDPQMDIVLAEWVRSQDDGLQGFVKSFQDKGLGQIIQSWISQGENIPITAEQIRQVLGNEKMNTLSDKFGVSAEKLSQQLAVHLPVVIDKLTPNGKLPDRLVSSI